MCMDRGLGLVCIVSNLTELKVYGWDFGYMVYGLWFVVYGLWFMVYGLWFMVYGLWLMVYG